MIFAQVIALSEKRIMISNEKHPKFLSNKEEDSKILLMRGLWKNILQIVNSFWRENDEVCTKIVS